MSATFRFMSWTPYKKRYDLVMLGVIVAYLLTFYTVGKLAWRGTHAISDEILIARALGTCGFLMLNVVLCIGPLARLDRRFLPLLYNRRHLGVATFLVGLLHGLLGLGFYHGFGRLNPVVSLVSGNVQYRSVSGFPFEALGVGALVILFLMAATSHDFWLKKLTPRVWKGLHMMVYAAWALLVMHVALGAVQAERNPGYVVGLIGVVLLVAGLHVVAGWGETARGKRQMAAGPSGWVDACAVEELVDGRGRVVVMPGKRERVALFRFDGKISAISNVCAHQGGPLGEGRIVDGCVTCPWHGFQYRPGDGCAPAPFTERLPTYEVRIEGGRVRINPEARRPGVAAAPAVIEGRREVAHV
jgi:nitrite reductase/ring-hydroxylating ferredoxin subunit